MKITREAQDAIEAALASGQATEGPRGNVLSEPFTDEVGRGPIPQGPVELRLPYPPTLNTYYRHVGSKVLISEAGREYRKKVCKIVSDMAIVGQSRCLTGRLSVAIFAHPPDRRERDLDNLLKGLLDSLQHAGLYESDSQIDSLLIRRGNTRPAGELFVIVRQRLEEQC